MSNIDINSFSKIELRVGKVLFVEKVENTDKLLHLKIDIGEDKPREIVSGIAEYFDPNELIGKTCVVVANLEPRSIKGIESNGMLLGASYKTSGEENFSLVETDAPIGTKLS